MHRGRGDESGHGIPSRRGGTVGIIARVLTDEDVERFVTDGYVHLPGAVPPALAARCAAGIWAALDADPDDPATWTEPVVRLEGFATPPFREAATTPPLRAAFDRLVGPGRWVPRTSLGTIPVRFPSDEEPGDDGWHVEADGAGPDGGPVARLRCPARALLMLFLFSDVGPDDAPTRLRVGSHLDVPAHLVAAGDVGRGWLELCGAVVAASEHRPEVTATGAEGDVYLCHLLLVHAAQPHHGRRPRLMAQPPLPPTGPFDLTDPEPPPVVDAVLRGLRAG